MLFTGSNCSWRHYVFPLSTRPSNPFLSTRYIWSSLREFPPFWHKHPLGTKDDFRFRLSGYLNVNLITFSIFLFILVKFHHEQHCCCCWSFTFKRQGYFTGEIVIIFQVWSKTESLTRILGVHLKTGLKLCEKHLCVRSLSHFLFHQNQPIMWTRKEYDSCFVFQSTTRSLVLLSFRWLLLHHVRKPYISRLYASVITVKMAWLSL